MIGFCAAHVIERKIYRYKYARVSLRSHILIQRRVRALPHAHARVIVARAVVVELGLLVQLLGGEQVGRARSAHRMRRGKGEQENRPQEGAGDPVGSQLVRASSRDCRIYPCPSRLPGGNLSEKPAPGSTRGPVWYTGAAQSVLHQEVW